MSRLCPECFAEQALKRRIQNIRARSTSTAKCSFHPRRKGVSAAAVAKLFDPVLRTLYFTGETLFDGEMEGDDLEVVVAELGGIADDRIARVISDQLIAADVYYPGDGEDAFYSDEFRYVNSLGVSDAKYSALWDRFRESILHDSRFFNDKAYDLLTEIFAGVHRQQSKVGPVVYFIGPKHSALSVFRARIADGREMCDSIRNNPATELSIPPLKKRRAGRMNASGIGVFYGAFDQNTCVAELRPAVGSVIMVGRFEIRRDLCVLDLSRFSEPQKKRSHFVPGQLERDAQWSFLQRFRHEISIAILESSSHLDYVPTQVVAEFIASKFMVKIGGEERGIDALIYNSAQHPGGKNIAIFGDANMVDTPTTGAGELTVPANAWLDDLFGSFGDDLAKDPALAILADHVTELHVVGAQYDVAEAYSSGFDEDE